MTTDTLLHALGWTIIHFLWQGAIIGLAAAAAIYTLRNNAPNTRCLVSIASLAACLLTFFATLLTLLPDTPLQTATLIPADTAPPQTTDTPHSIAMTKAAKAAAAASDEDEEESSEDQAKELGGDEDEVVLDMSGGDDDDEAPGKMPAGFSEDGVDDDEDDESDDIDLDEEFDLGDDIDLDDGNELGEPDADDIEPEGDDK